VELSGIIMEINDLRKKGRKQKEETGRQLKIVDFNLHYPNRFSWMMRFSGFFLVLSSPIAGSPLTPHPYFKEQRANAARAYITII
jgi:hypothetical protein